MAEKPTAGQVIAMNQYKEVFDRGYMPALTPWPRICLTVSIATGRGPLNSATPLHMNFCSQCCTLRQ